MKKLVSWFMAGFIAGLALCLMACLSACSANVGPAQPEQDDGGAVCDTITPEAGGDPSLCGVPDAGAYSSAGDIKIIMLCDRPIANPWWNDGSPCQGEGFAQGRVWCCK